MYLFLYITILINIILITKIRYKTIIKSNILFTTMWCICSGISSLGLYGVNKPNEKVHFYVLTVIFVFNIVYIIFNKYDLKKHIILKGEARLKIIYIMNIMSWVYLSKFLGKSINIILNGGFKTLREYAFDSLGTTFELIICQWIVTPIIDATIIIAIIYIVLKKKSKLLNTIAFISLILHVIIFGGRLIIVRAVVYYLLAFILVKSKNINNLNRIKINKVMLLVFSIALTTLTIMRSWHGTTIFKEVVLYFTSSFSFLDTLLRENTVNSSVFMLGKGILGFIYNIILAPITLLRGIPYTGSDYILTQITSIPRVIGDGITYNALGTMIYPLLLDLGYIGIIIGTAFFSIVVTFIEKILSRTGGLVYICIYIYLGCLLFMSTMNYYMIFPSTGFTLIMLFIFIKINDCNMEGEKYV